MVTSYLQQFVETQTRRALLRLLVEKTYTTCGTPDYFSPEVRATALGMGSSFSMILRWSVKKNMLPISIAYILAVGVSLKQFLFLSRNIV